MKHLQNIKIAKTAINNKQTKKIIIIIIISSINKITDNNKRGTRHEKTKIHSNTFKKNI